MKLDKALELLIPGLVLLERVSGIPSGRAAKRMILAIGLQESGFKYRYQKLSNGRAGPARGWFQFERGGGVAGVMTHHATAGPAARVCTQLEVEHQTDAVWRALEGNDALAACFARLLLWSDPYPLPTEVEEGWKYYLRLWRPGRPHPTQWGECWRQASAAVAQEEAQL